MMRASEGRCTRGTRKVKAAARLVRVALLAVVATLAATASANAAQWTPGAAFPVWGAAGIDVGADGNLWVVEGFDNSVGKFAPDGKRLLTVGGFGTAPGEFNLPSAVAVGPNGDVFVTDVGGDRVQHFTDDGTLVGTFGSGGSGPGQFENPRGVAVDASGNVYVADVSNGRLQKFSASGDYVEAIGEPFQFGAPFGVEVDPDGNLWVTDTNGGTVRKIAPDGTLLQTLTGFGQPLTVAIDGSGQVHIVNFDRQRVETYSPSGTLVDQLQFNGYVHSIALGRNGNLYATVDTSEVRTFTPPAPADTDGDGIPDAIDGDPGIPSTSFRDAAGHNGSVVSNPGLAVSFVDLPDPDGVKISVAGPSTSRVTLTLCVPADGSGPGFTVRLNGGSSVEAFCGSVRLKVVSGQAEVALGATTVQMTQGVTGKVSDNGDGTFAVDHFAGDPITITSPAGTTSLSDGRLPTLDVTPPKLTVPGSTVNLRPTGADGITYGTAAGYPGVSATDDRTATPRVTCTPEAPNTFALGSDTTVSCTATDEAGLSTTKQFTVHVGVTPTTLCSLTLDLVRGSTRYKALTTAKRTALANRVTTACAPLDRLTASMTSTQKSAIVTLYGRAMDGLATEGWLTTAQATRLKGLAAQM